MNRGGDDERERSGLLVAAADTSPPDHYRCDNSANLSVSQAARILGHPDESQKHDNNNDSGRRKVRTPSSISSLLTNFNNRTTSTSVWSGSSSGVNYKKGAIEMSRPKRWARRTREKLNERDDQTYLFERSSGSSSTSCGSDSDEYPENTQSDQILFDYNSEAVTSNHQSSQNHLKKRRKDTLRGGISANLNEMDPEERESRRRRRHRDLLMEPTIEFVWYDLRPEDTLIGLSVRSGFSRGTLRRLNGVTSDSQLIALRRIKLPVKSSLVKTMSPITQALNQKFSDPASETVSTPQRAINDNGSTVITVAVGQFPQWSSFGDHYYNYTPQPQQGQLESDRKNVIRSEPSGAKSFLEHMDRDLERIVSQTTKAQTRSHSPLEQLNGNPVPGIPYRSKSNLLSAPGACDGADCGVSWSTALILALLVCIVIPLLYFALVEEEHPHHLGLAVDVSRQH